MSSRTSPKLVMHTLLALFFVAAPNLHAQSQDVRSPSPAINKWEALIPEIAETLQHSGKACPAADHANIDVTDAFDLDADGLSYALVDYCQVGAYTDWVIVMHLEGGKPVLSRLVTANGAQLDTQSLSGASVMHSFDVKLVPEKKAIFYMSYDRDSRGRLKDCGVGAYVWNPRLRAFQADTRLSREATQDYCREERNR